MKKILFYSLYRSDASGTPLFKAQQLNPLGVCYVEVNNNNMLNAGSYTLQNTNRQLLTLPLSLLPISIMMFQKQSLFQAIIMLPKYSMMSIPM
jgi:hypothetical protein